ncbi:hypothetical protein [Cyanobacterium sp. Dongsha4]|uniref:hypothetical protein n=1 Tax=Cyanobacterium sp. DS4 TaxID=2878255 RepID=UPI002E81CEA5|nr:hypothetical protein [Cyanobacterium sp. Dongsha4]WVL00916.1 hypothetical protein Dongsha4_01595 [Cyanobacterium sp. Dongsha4]
MKKTFIDSGVLIFAARGEGKLAEKALSVLEDSEREFASSIFIQLEILPKAIYNKKQAEIEFYQTYFEAVFYWATDLENIIKKALEEASNYGTEQWILYILHQLSYFKLMNLSLMKKQINPFIVAKALTLSPFMIYNIVHALLIPNKNNRRFYI